MVPGCEPAEEGFNIDQEDERRESISLDSTPPYRNGVSDATRGRIDQDFGANIRVDASDGSDRIRREAEISHDFEEFLVVYGVEGIREINVEEVDVVVEPRGILEAVDEALQLSRGALSGSEAFLSIANDVVRFCKVSEGDGDESGPEFIDGGVQAYWSFIFKMAGVALLVEYGGVGAFPLNRSVSCQPKELEEVVDGRL